MTPPRTATSPRRPAPAPDRPPHLQVVRGRPVPGRRPPLVILIAVLATCASLFMLVAANVVIGQGSFRQAELSARVQAKRRQVEQLSLEVERLRSPARVAARAKELGMIPATAFTVLVPTTPSTRSGPSPVREGR